MPQWLPKSELAELVVIPRWELLSRPSYAVSDFGISGYLRVSQLDISIVVNMYQTNYTQ
jgi:cytochrome c oxidase subunit IV